MISVYVFQSTHPRGVRQGQRRGATPNVGFQSTHPRGVRRALTKGLPTFVRVSIHAPTRGATSHRHMYTAQIGVSIHAPTRGATKYGRSKSNLIEFQSTHPRGVRLFFSCSSTIYPGFNPRTHEGCDQGNSKL